jgi:formylglycine-generating enzyme
MTPNDTKKSCCTPATRRPALPAATQAPPTGSIAPDAVLIPGGRALVGTEHPQIPDDGEDPVREVRLKPFRIGATTVTNAQFHDFISATDHVTEAERFGWSFVFWAQVPETVGPTQGVVAVEWWRRVEGANWRDINGPGTMQDAWHPDHPVVQVSWNDAQAYARWVAGRLPTEAEWEHAARGGLGEVKFPWGDREPDDADFQPCNIWQGRFPEVNTGKDGFVTTAPARHYAPNGFGLYNMVGNVWEWTSEPYRIKSLKRQVRQRLDGMKGYKLSKGGSYLCHRSYCFRYRVAARSGTSPDSTTTHQGFRVVWPA